MIDPHNIYFYFIFTVQILLVSWYVPSLFLKRMRTVLKKYPASEYPKLYTKPYDSYINRQRKFAMTNRILLTVGFSLLSAIIMWDYNTTDNISQMIPWAYFMIQMMPMMWLEISESQYFKAMRAVNTNTQKVANIRPRHLFDFISKKLLTLTLLMMLFSFMLVIINYGVSGSAFENLLIILLTNVFFGVMIYWNIYGRKKDPYQANKDRLQGIKVNVKSALFVSIGVSLFLSVHMLIKIYDVKYLQPIVMSLYCQLILWFSTKTRLNGLKLSNIDFSVYKKSNEE